MANRATRRHAAPDPPPEIATGGKYTVAGEWYVFGPMTGRDWLFLRALVNRKLTDKDLEALFALFERRITSSSVPDPLDRPLSELTDLAIAWFTGKTDEALPPESATS